jgi:DNA-binding transcriptional MerR regulator
LDKSPEAFRTISEVAEELDIPQHVLRFWESRFHEIKPMKRGGGRRYYRPQDVDLLRGIRHLLYGEGYTIRGVQRLLREQGHRFVQSVWRPGAPQPTPEEGEREPSPVGWGASLKPDELPRHADAPDSGSEPEPVNAPQGRLSPTQVQQLRSALQELVECRRLLQDAVALRAGRSAQEPE